MKTFAVILGSVLLASAGFASSNSSYIYSYNSSPYYGATKTTTRTPRKPKKPKRPSSPAQPPEENSAPSSDGSTAAVPSNLDTCFSPGENCDQKLIGLINSTQSTLDIAIYSITHTGIAQAIVDAKNRGVQVRMVVDRSESRPASSQVANLANSGISMKYGNFKGIMHDKFTISDGKILETGSYNYSMNATDNNAENQLYITDSSVIQRYQQNFDQMFSDGLTE